jgi:CBS domain-containing protein
LTEICTPDVTACTGDITPAHAVRLMRGRHVGKRVIGDESSEALGPIGIVTNRDIVVEVLAKDLDPATLTVRTIVRVPLVIARLGRGGERARADESARCAPRSGGGRGLEAHRRACPRR